jgi:predicted metalloprotease
MKLEGHELSRNVEDRRGRRGPAIAGGGGLVVVVIVILMRLLGAPPEAERVAVQVAQGIQQRAADQGPADDSGGIDDASKVFVSQVLKSTENVWSDLVPQYTPPRLILFTDSVVSGCGSASAAMGPFYCPADQRVYIDPVFFDELATRHKASGDFAQAYVIAHEVAHHLQNLIGYSDRVNEIRARGDELMSNQASVRLELQADYLAGVWAHYAHKEYDILSEGDIEEGINAANRIGDDTLQMEAQGYKVPERYTHGTSDQRAKWFKKGLQSGDVKACDELFRIAYNRL